MNAPVSQETHHQPALKPLGRIAVAIIDIFLVVAVLLATTLTIVAFALATPIFLLVSAISGKGRDKSGWQVAKAG